MLHEYIPDQVAETLEHLCRHWADESNRSATELDHLPTSRLTVALSREAGTQGTAVGREIGRRLGWAVYDHDLLKRIAQDMGVHAHLLTSVDERHTGWLKETFDSFLGLPAVGENAFVHRLVKAVLALGSHGECVVVGRGAPFLLPAETTLRVRLIAPLKDRVREIVRQFGVTEQEAKRQIAMIDRQRNEFVQNHFFKDPADPEHYDLVLNFGRYGIAGCAELIVSALESLHIYTNKSLPASHSEGAMASSSVLREIA